MSKELEEKNIEELKYELETQPEEDISATMDEQDTLNETLENLSLYLRFGSTILPTVAAGAGAGTTPGTPSLTNANDTKGQISIITGTSTPAGVILTLTFARDYNTAPIVLLTPANAVTANIMVSSKIVALSTKTTFTINSTTTALADSTAFSWYYYSLE